MPDYRDLFLEAEKKLKEQDEFLQKLAEGAIKYATVLEIFSKKVLLSQNNEFFEAHKPKGMSLKTGDYVKVLETGQIFEKVTTELPVGDIGTVISSNTDNISAEVEVSGRIRNILIKEKVEAGDRVIVDPSLAVSTQKLPGVKKTAENIFEVHWEDIGGLELAKQQIIEAVELPYKNLELYKYYGKQVPKGILLYGPPGCGKTMLANAAATSIMKTYKGRNTDTAFIYVKGPELLNPYVGVTEQLIRQLFTSARKHKANTGFPAVIFLDEAEALLSKRGSSLSSDVDKTIVPMFLTEMSGLEDSAALIILATNRPDMLDSAITRDGRIDIKINVTRPNEVAALEIISRYINKKPSYINTKILADAAIKLIFNESLKMYSLKDTAGKLHHFNFSQLLNGSMLASVVEKAATYAFRRDFKEKTKTGIQIDDMYTAIFESFESNFSLNHDDELSAYIEDNNINILEIKKEKYEKTLKNTWRS